MSAATAILPPPSGQRLRLVRFASLENWSPASSTGNLSFHGDIPLRPLAEALRAVRNPVIVQDAVDYHRVTVRINGNGVCRRDTVKGTVIKTKRQFLVKAGQLIMSRIDARNGAFGLIPEELDGAIVTNDFPVFAVRQDRMLPDYLRLVLSTPQFREYCQTLSKGTTNRQRMDEGVFLSIPIPFPSIDAQSKLIAQHQAASAEAAAAEIRAREADLQVVRFLEESLGLNARHQPPQLTVSKLYFTQFATLERWALSDPSEQQKSAYSLVALGTLLDVVQYGLSNKAGRAPTPTPLLRMNNVQNGELDFTEMKYLKGTPSDFAACLLQKGDILFNRTNSKELVGKTAVFVADGEFAFASYLIRLRVKPDLANPLFINHVFNSPFCRAQIDAISRQALGQANMNSKELRRLMFPLPPLPEQERIVTELDRLRAEARAARASAAARRDAAAQAFHAALFAG